MQYVLTGTEVLLQNDDGLLTRLSPTQIWQQESTQTMPGNCTLASLGLSLNESLLNPYAILRESNKSPFGEIVICVKDFRGIEHELSEGHESDHVALDNQWFPLFENAIADIASALSDNSIEPYGGLDATSYLTCIREQEYFDWLKIRWKYNAKEWVMQDHKSYEPPAPAHFVANLFDYQEKGSNWLSMMAEHGAGMILGDGMGLGKTIQIIKAICDLLEKKPSARSLIICPTALVENWRREFAKFTLGIDVECHVGSDRTRNYRHILSPVVITTYDIARIDRSVLNQIPWDYVILDEAQFIKNPDSKRANAIKKINRRVGIAVTGTPFENHMTDIWSLMDFCLPGFLGSKAMFVARYQDEEDSAYELGEIIAPLLLRRRLSDIPNDLPELIKMPMPIALRKEEAEEYEARRRKYIENGFSLGAINHLIGDLSYLPGMQDGISELKYEYLNTVLEEVFSNSEKIIVFAERLLSIDNLEKRYGAFVPVFTLTGQTATSDRQTVIDEFSRVQGAAMLISNPTVGGAGLNITAANHVFHFSPQWNPAKFDQADARAHRHGQNKTVIAHYPFYAGTIEEYMWNKVATKRDLASMVTVGNKGDSDANDIIAALSLSPVIHV